jgi:ribonuclease E
VQVVKEPTGKKGAFLTTYLSLAGRYFVLTPGREQVGVSRKIEGEEERAKLKEISEHLEPGLGVIVRTACHDEPKTRLLKDLTFLKRLFKDLREKATTAKAPSLVSQEMDLASRAVRDYLTADVSEIWIDDPEVREHVATMAELVFPRRKNLVRLHEDPERTLWERFNLKRQIDEIYGRDVELPSGGRLVIDQAEALTAVDINSGKIGGRTSFKETAHKTNMEAAEEIARQLRLRDIGGQIVVDFIEMRDKNHIREVEKTLKTAVKADRARTDVGRISRFGLLELVRQRLGSSALSVSTEPCPCCNGTGHRRNMEWQALQALKEIYFRLRRNGARGPVIYEAGEELALYLANRKREKLMEFEKQFQTEVRVAVKGNGLR